MEQQVVEVLEKNKQNRVEVENDKHKDSIFGEALYTDEFTDESGHALREH